MARQTSRLVPISMLAALTLMTLMLVADSVAQDPKPQAAAGRGSLELLDRGSTVSSFAPGPPMMATLAVGAGTPGVTMVGVISFAAPSNFRGNFYTAPGDFPTSWFPFDVTGAFAWASALPAAPGSVTLGAGVAPGPFAGGGGTMWGAFATAMSPLPAFMTPAVFGKPGIFPGAPTPALPVPTGAGVACGLHITPGGPGLGGLASAAATRFLHSFGGPPLSADFLVPQPYPALIDWVAGCYVTGATVPVELQSFQID